eukprot:364054-Chlamydomonas_euryale.AAC.12
MKTAVAAASRQKYRRCLFAAGQQARRCTRLPADVAQKQAIGALVVVAVLAVAGPWTGAVVAAPPEDLSNFQVVNWVTGLSYWVKLRG